MDHISLYTMRYEGVSTWHIPVFRAVTAAQQTRHDACWGCHQPVRRVETPDGRTLLLDATVARDGAYVFIERGWARELGAAETTLLDRYRVHRCPGEGDRS